MRVIAEQGDGVYLVEVDKENAVVVDYKNKKVLPLLNTQSILARGYWEAYNGPQEILFGLRDLIDAALKFNKIP